MSVQLLPLAVLSGPVLLLASVAQRDGSLILDHYAVGEALLVIDRAPGLGLGHVFDDGGRRR